MLDYTECKEIALKCANYIGVEINKVSELKTAYIFENENEECIGKLPMVVDKRNGNVFHLWQYLNDMKYTMDDMKEISF